MEVKKMIIAHLIDRITVSAGNKIEVTFNISVQQFMNYQQATKKAHNICYGPSLTVVEMRGIEPLTS